MNQEEKTHWTQDKILLYVKACMSATGLTRMPSRSELSEYYGNDKLTNAIRRFPGGYYKIPELLEQALLGMIEYLEPGTLPQVKQKVKEQEGRFEKELDEYWNQTIERLRLDAQNL